MLDPHSARSVLWQKQRRTQIAAAAAQGGVAILPTGAVEQHGPHLPLDTDSYSAFTISVLAAEQVDTFPVLVLPPIWWGLSPYWMGFSGTLTLRPETLIDVIYDVSRSVAQHGFHKVAILNGHGGNDGLIQAAAIKASTDGLRVAAMSYWNLIPDVMREVSERDGGTIGHSGEMETSIQLALQPACVDVDAVTAEQCFDISRGGEMEARVNAGLIYTPPNPAAESPHGVYGQALAGNKDKGERVVRAAAQRLAEFLREFRDS